MTRSPASPRPFLVAGVAAALLMGGACSSGDDGEEAAPEDTFAVEQPTDVEERCEDPQGDLLTGSGASVVEPLGIDLVLGEVAMVDDVLSITWTAAGDPAAVPGGWFTVLQGSPGEPLSWELRVDTDDEGRWRTLLLTNERVTDDPRIVRRQVETPLPVVPTFEGDSVHLRVPTDLLPTAASVAWLFGSAVGGEDGVEAVFDDCSNLYASTAPDPGTSETEQG